VPAKPVPVHPLANTAPAAKARSAHGEPTRNSIFVLSISGCPSALRSTKRAFGESEHSPEAACATMGRAVFSRTAAQTTRFRLNA
jgi:hypothetical protein